MGRVTVIGGGVGGLSIAVLLQSKGFQTTIMEKMDQLGGMARAQSVGGSIIEGGPVIVTLPNVVFNLYDQLGLEIEKELKFIETEDYNLIQLSDDSDFHFYNDKDKLLDEVKKINPFEVGNYCRFNRKITEISKLLLRLDSSKSEIISMYDIFKLVPRLIRNQLYQNAYRFTSNYFQDERLKTIFSFKVLALGNPLTTNSAYLALVYSLNNQGKSIKGGMYELINNLQKHFLRLGGKIKTNTEIKFIQRKKGRVVGTLSNNNEFKPADIIISNADIQHTIKDLLRTSDLKLNHSKYSHSYFILYYMTDKEYETIPHQTQIFQGSYYKYLQCLKYNYYTFKDFVLYNYSPQRIDNRKVGLNRDIFYIASAVPNLKTPIDWTKIKTKYGDKLITILEKKLMPKLSTHIINKSYFTPIDFKEKLNTTYGNVSSLEPTIYNIGPMRYPGVSKKIRGLFFVGSATKSGAGISTSMMSAIQIYKIIIKSGKLNKSTI